MTAYSKYINKALQGRTCHDLIHPWTRSCRQSFLDYMGNWSCDGFKFFFPAIMISLVMKTKDNYTRAILKGLYDITMCTVIGHISFALAMSWSCIFCNVLKGCYYSTTVLIPTFLGAQTVNLLPHNAIVGHANPFACMMAYVGCYRLTHCLFNNFTNGITSDFVNIAAGFTAGLAYAIWPNYNLFTTCIVTMLQVYWQYLLNQENCPKAVKEINRLPLGGLVYGVCMAVAVQVMVFYPDKTARLSYSAIKANSSGAVDGLKFILTRPLFDHKQ
uniref:Transmembrane protein 135 N-terminal domain-containing protein n=2 Tax=Lutzomyia longipalpis TaxID=7200 RepID=A0A1B0ESL8_LUTLO